LFLFAVLHHFCQYFDLFEIEIGAADISALSKTTKALKSGKKSEKKQNVWHWAKFSTGATFIPGVKIIPVLHLGRSQLNVMNVFLNSVFLRSETEHYG